MSKPFTPLLSAILSADRCCSPAGLAGCRPTAGPPDEPSVVEFDEASGKTVGKPGGELHMLVGRAKDTRLMVVYGYARLVGYDQKLELVPDILKDVEVEDGRIFTLHLRKGHRWSDGEPFTSEDFRYWWEDVANNEALSPTGPSPELFVDGELPKVEFPDPLTVRYSWSKPNPFFLPALAQATPLFIYMPAHYLKQFHERYADPDKLAAMVKETQARDWAQLHGRNDDMYKFENPEPADPAALARDHAAAGRALRVRAQPVLPPGRPRAASSCPTSTGSCSTWSTTSWSRSRPAPARPISSRAACSSSTTPS